MTKFPESSSIAEVPVAPDVKLFMVVQRTRPLESDKTRSELLVTTSFPGEPLVIGLSRLATHTYVRLGVRQHKIRVVGHSQLPRRTAGDWLVAVSNPHIRTFGDVVVPYADV